MLVVYPEAVHYDENGQWEEIDNTLSLTTAGTYATTAGDWNVSFPQQLTTENKITITQNGYTLGIGMSGQLRSGSTTPGLEIMSAGTTESAQETFSVDAAQVSTAQLQNVDLSQMKAETQYEETVVDKLYSGLQYANVYTNTDVEYDVSPSQVKESIIISTHDAQLRGYQYSLEVGNMIPVLEEDGHIDLFDENGEEIIMVMPAPYMVDSAGVYNDDIEVSLNQNGTSWTLTYLVPQEWLAEEEREWPVILDPVVRKKSTSFNVWDRTVAEEKVLSADWGMNGCGYRDGWGVHRFYLMFLDLPTLKSSDFIIDATVELYDPYNHVTVSTVEVHKVLETWTESGISWTDKPEYDETVEDFARVNEKTYYWWNVTDIVRGWYAGENTGMMFKMPDSIETTQTSSWKQFYSTEFGSIKPTLYINYRNNNGLESYWDYTSSSAGRAGTGYVNNYTGNLVWVRSDIGFGGNRMPVSISHIYNANDADNNDFGMGYGWRTNFNQLVYHFNSDDAATDYYIWEDSDGTEHYFAYSSSGTYKDEDGLELTLTTTGSGTEKYCITDKYGNCSYFDTHGRLSKQSNNQSTKSSITVTYTTTSGYLISAITDGAGRVYSFAYSGGLLGQISYKGTGSTVLSYVNFGYSSSQLTTVTDKDGEKSTFAYGSNHLLTSATDVDGYKVVYTFNVAQEEYQPNRVVNIAEYSGATQGGSLSIEYSHNQTTFTDANGNIEIVQFNNYGNTISIQDGLGRAQYATYATETQTSSKSNQMTLSSKLQNTVSNHLRDNSMEIDGGWAYISSSISASLVTDQAYSGKGCLKVTKKTDGDLSGIYCSNLDVEAGETVTFSAYIKSGDSAVGFEVSDGTTTILTDSMPANNDWTRLQGSYTNTSDTTKYVRARITVTDISVTYVDCVQAEIAATASRFNLLSNADFHSGTVLYSWTKSGACTDSDTRVRRSSTACPQLDEYMVAITGSPTAEKYISQTVNVSGEAGDTYVLAGWAKGDAVPNTEYAPNTREFCLKAIFNNTDGTTTECVANFNPDTDSNQNWQYTAAAAVAAKDYSSITVQMVYSYNANTVYFDGIQLYKEEFGNSYTYDDDGNITSVVDLQKQTTTYEYYDGTSDIQQIIQDNKAKMTYTYDDYHNVLTATSSTGAAYSFTYDKWGNNTSVTITSGSVKLTSTATYSTDGNRLVSTTDAAGKVTTYNYNADTNVLEWVQYPEDTEETRTNYTYDTMYRLATAAVTTDTGSALSASYTYTDDLLTEIETASTTYTFDYGAFALRDSISIGSRTLAQYTYTDKNHYLSALDYGNGDKVEYTYDSYGRVTLQTYEDGDTIAYQYNNDGALATVTDSATGRTTSYYYDFTDRLMKYVEEGTDYSHSVAYEYDTLNNLTSIVETINSGKSTTSYAYDDDNRVTSVTNGDIVKSYTYDGFSRVSNRVTKNGSTTILTDTVTYRSPESGKTTGQVETLKHTAENYSVTYSYTYDDNGNILSVSDGTYTTSYVYDSANQLIRENNEAAGKTWIWGYDKAGNIRSRRQYSYTTGTLGTVENSRSYVYADREWGDLLTTCSIGMSFSYDAIGNPLSDGVWTYTWEHGRQLASMTNGITTWTYTYDANGMRTKRTNGTMTYSYVYNGSQLSQMTAGNHMLNFTYDASGTPMTVNYNGIEYYYVTNLQGDVVAILNGAGTAVVQYTYDAWGNILTITGTKVSTLGTYNPLRYRGYVYDRETGLYYVSSRYYDPEIGRFINADDIDYLGADGSPLSYNLFAYCMNNPVNRFDVNGNWSLPNWAKVAIGAVATVAAVAVTVATGGAAAPVLIGVAASTIGGAAVSAVNHRVTTGSWEGAGKAALDGAADGFMTGGLCALGGSVVGGAARTIKNAKSGITIGKTGQFEKVAELAKTRHYSGLKEFNFIKKVAGQKAAETVGWWQNKCVVKGVMALKGAIYDCGGALTGAYAKEVALTKGYQYLYNVWLM